MIYHIDDVAGSNNENRGYPGQSGWPSNGNHYRIALLQADGNYNLEKNDNRGDSGDVFEPGAGRLLGPGPQFAPGEGTYPNTDGYQNGDIVRTDIYITNIQQASGDDLVFDISLPDGGTAFPTASPAPHTIEVTIKTDDWSLETGVSIHGLLCSFL